MNFMLYKFYFNGAIENIEHECPRSHLLSLSVK